MTNGDRPNAYEEVINNVAFAESLDTLENDHERGDTGRSNTARDALVNLATRHYIDNGEYVPESGLEFGDKQYQAGIGFVKDEAEQRPRDIMAGSIDDVVSEMPVFSSFSDNSTSKQLAKTGISLPSFPDLSSKEFQYIIDLRSSIWLFLWPEAEDMLVSLE